MNGVLNFLGSILDFLNPFSENFFGYKLWDILSQGLINIFTYLFVPSEERFTAISNTVNSKFGFIDTIKEAINSLSNIFNNLGNSPVIETTEIQSKYYNGRLKIIDMSFYAPFKNYGDVVITGFVYLFFLWRLYCTIPSIINGSSPNTISFLIKGGK